MLERSFRPPQRVSLALTLGPLRRGAGDPCMRIGADGVWRASRTPHGPATVHLTARDGEVRVRAWGPGAAWAVDAAPALVGAHDDPAGFEPRHPVLAGLARRLPGLRIPRSGAVTEALVPTVLEQKVTGIEAKRSYRALVRALGEPAPGPSGATGLLVPPAPETLAATPSYAFHPHGVERRRAETIRRACAVAPRLEEVASMAPADARRRLCAVPGVGPWTAAEVALVALGDTDAVSLDDFHLPHQVAWALAGEARADDARMLELLEPYRGHRGRVIRLIVAGGIQAPRFGPRHRLRSIAAI
ncbi:MAG: DNA-3-methyladenine glycosylase family protein [Acidimicrobiales bacterium]